MIPSETTEPTLPVVTGDGIPIPPEHLARCAECGETVGFTALASGSGFTLMTNAPEQVYGCGPNGRPECPNGHGEMELADDQILARDAIGHVAEQLGSPAQRTLPGIIPAFNFQGAYLELETMSVEADRLHRIWENDARKAKESKLTWEETSKRRDKAALEFRRRRLDKDDGDPEQGATVADEAPAPDAIDAADLWERVRAAGQFLLPDTIEGWTADERAAVDAWAADPTLERPKVLGTPHVAPNGHTSETHDKGQTSVEFQTCTQCDERILTIEYAVTPYDTGALVGTDCPGKPKKAGPDHHYPKKTGKKKAGKTR